MAVNEAAGEQKPEAYPPGYGEDFLRAENKVDGHFQLPLLTDWDKLPYPRAEAARIAALNEHKTRPAESADEAFARREAGYPSGRSFFDVV